MNKVKNIAKNTSYLTLALIIQKLISFSYFIILARYLGMEVLGQYYTAVAFTTILALVVDLGFSNILIREIAKDQNKTDQWLRPIIGLKLILSILAALIGYILAKIAGYNPLILNLISISFLAMLLDSFTNTFFSVIRGFHNLKFESLAAIFFQVIVFILGIFFIQKGFSAIWLMIAMAIASLVNFIFSVLIAKFKFSLNILPQFNLFLSKKIFQLSWPFALFNILQRTYSYLDSLLLGFLASYTQVGLYQIAFKIVFALQFLPLAFVASLYPAMSAYWQNNRDQLSITFKRAMNYLIIIALPIIFGVIAISQEIVALMGAEEGAVWPLRIIMLSLLFIFLNFPVGSLLNACDRQKRNTFNMAIATMSSVLLNLIFIPLWQAIGASLTVLLTNFLMLILGLRASYGLINYRFSDSIPLILKVIFSSCLMALIVFFGRELINLYLSIIIGALIYFILLYLLGGFSRADILSISNSFFKKTKKI
jgi:O-antigen/teichoic acid export membrane protein